MSFKINGYTLTYGPQTMEETNNVDMVELQVPYGDKVIVDGGSIQQEVTFEVTLRDEEINDIKGMIEAYRLIHIDFGDYYGWFYVKKFDISWIKYLNGHKIATYSMGGYYIGDNYLSCSWFSGYQETDFNLTKPTIVYLPNTYVSKETLAEDYVRGLLDVYLDPVGDLKFKANPNIFANGCNTLYTNKGVVYYNTKDWSVLGIDNKSLRVEAQYDDFASICEINDISGNTYTSITDNLDDLGYSDVILKHGAFKSVLTLNHCKIIVDAFKDHVEIIPGPQALTLDDTDITVVSKTTDSYGTQTPTIDEPQSVLIDSRIGANTPEYVDFTQSPGYIHFDTTSSRCYCLVSTQTTTQPRNGILGYTERNYVLVSDVVPIYGSVSDWALVGSWTAQTDGNTYDGPADYVYTTSNAAHATITKTISNPGFYDIYVVASNQSASVSTEWKFYLDTVDQGTITTTTSQQHAQIVYMGNHDLDSGSHTFKVAPTIVGGLRLWYLLLVPTDLDSGDSLDKNIRAVMKDTRMAFEVE